MRREAKANAAAWLEKTRWCTNGCGKEAARYDDSPGHALRYSGACSPECEEAVEQRKTQNAKSEPTAPLLAQVGSTDGLGAAVSPAPTFEKTKC